MIRTNQSESTVVIATLRHLGIDPLKAVDNPMMQAVVVQYTKGEIDNAQFKRCCENMLIFNPSLKAS